ncbi:unnamed protein product [Brassicogethes aeneus]|uniref:Peptidase S1 domain-containing protein n=1 Tax=Brassicogethes aeneus TaxID=1431903 RepID=A0A9P0FH21_BRAAE|nr:unnamed protein product [Brassicogethes aeneus]
MKIHLFLIASLLFIFTNANVRIVGGDDVNITQHPYQVSLLYNGLHICGGTIIRPRTILTAAHCTDGFISKELSIRYGSSYINTGGKVINVKEIHQHPNYTKKPIDYDVSVLILKSSINNASTRIANLANNTLKDGTNCIVTGWGTKFEGGPASNSLQKIILPFIPLNICNIYYEGYVKDRFICAGYLREGGKDACQGDSGGPLVVNNTLYGIVSFGNGCAEPRSPGVYTSVLAVKDYINSVSKSKRHYFSLTLHANIMLVLILFNII